jgi:IclR family pca regulon transcriptional regulator
VNTTIHDVKALPGTQAVLRAMDLLKSFPAEQPERSLTELAQAVGLNRTTTYRLLTALQSEGMIEREGAVYRLGPELMALGARASGSGSLRAAARLELATLAAEEDETFSIEVLVGRDVLILDEALGRRLLTTVPSLGTRWPAHATSTGKVLLAWAPEGVVDELLAEPLPRLTPRTIVEPARFRKELTRVRQEGHAVTREELEAGFVAAAVPLLGMSGAVVAALSAGGPTVRLTAERVAGLVKVLEPAAARISERLGYRSARHDREKRKR